MALNKHKKIEYIRHVLEQVVNDSIDSKDDLILIEVVNARILAEHMGH